MNLNPLTLPQDPEHGSLVGLCTNCVIGTASGSLESWIRIRILRSGWLNLVNHRRYSLDEFVISTDKERPKPALIGEIVAFSLVIVVKGEALSWLG
jgi:hypothetical protein